MPMSLMQLRDKIQAHDLRRATIGLGFGICAIALLNIITISKNDISFPDQSLLDSELVSISDTKTQNSNNPTENIDGTEPLENDETDTPADPLQSSDNFLFSHFKKNKSSLTQDKIDAIKNNTPHVSVIINNVGQRRSDISTIIEKFPNDVTIGMSSHTNNHTDFIKKLADYGFETWMSVATIENQDYTDFGSYALNPTTNFENNIQLLGHQLKNKGGLTGLIIPRNSLIIQTSELWKEIVEDVYAQGYGILDNTTRIMAPNIYVYDGVRAPYLKGDQSIEKSLPINDLKSRLVELERNIIDQKSMIITITLQTPLSLDILSQWLKSLGENGITLVPLSAQAKL